MRLLNWLLLVGISGCSLPGPGLRGATPRPEPGPTVDVSSEVSPLLAEASVALAAEQWADAIRSLSDAHAIAEEPQRNDIAFFLGYALYRQGQALAGGSGESNVPVSEQALRCFERARVMLGQTDHPLRDQVLRAIDRFLAGHRERMALTGMPGDEGR